MATYGEGPGGAITTYDGASDNDPTAVEMVRALYSFFGLAGGEVYAQAPWEPPWLYRLLGNRLATPVESAAFLKASADFGLGAVLTPSGWIDYGLALGDYIRSTHVAVTGSVDPLQVSGGGGTRFDDVSTPRLLADGVQQAATVQPLLADDILRIQQAIVEYPLQYHNALYGNGATSIWRCVQMIPSIASAFLAYGGAPVAGSAHINAVFPTPDVAVDYLGGYTLAGYSEAPLSVVPGDAVLDETLLSHLQRTQPAYAWDVEGPFSWMTTDFCWARDTNGYDVWYRCTIARSEWADLVAASRAVIVPPVWPGGDFVTLGTTLTDCVSGRYDLPCDGVILSITGHRPGQGKQVAGGLTLWQHSGWIAFLDDGARAEPLQWLGLDSITYTPRGMKRAAGWVLWTAPGVLTAVTPWDKA